MRLSLNVCVCVIWICLYMSKPAYAYGHCHFSMNVFLIFYETLNALLGTSLLGITHVEHYEPFNSDDDG
jgi:hypothetical protein